jgi:hypothetical protein
MFLLQLQLRGHNTVRVDLVPITCIQKVNAAPTDIRRLHDHLTTAAHAASSGSIDALAGASSSGAKALIGGAFVLSCSCGVSSDDGLAIGAGSSLWKTDFQ